MHFPLINFNTDHIQIFFNLKKSILVNSTTIFQTLLFIYNIISRHYPSPIHVQRISNEREGKRKKKKKYDSLDRPIPLYTTLFCIEQDPLICRVKKSDVLSQPQSWKISRAPVEQHEVISIARNRINSKTASRTWSSHERVRLVRVATRFELITFDPVRAMRMQHAIWPCIAVKVNFPPRFSKRVFGQIYIYVCVSRVEKLIRIPSNCYIEYRFHFSRFARSFKSVI